MQISADSLFQAMANTTRLRCLLLLQGAGELCVCELTDLLEASQPKVSRHLANLREAGLVADRRQGQWIYYRLVEELPSWVKKIIGVCAAGVGERPPFDLDRRRLKAIIERRQQCL